MGNNKRFKQGFGSVISQYQAQQREDKMFNLAREEAVIVTLGLIIDRLISDHWDDEETAKKNVPELVRGFMSIYDAYIHGAVTIGEIAEYIDAMSGVEIQLKHVKLNKGGKWEKVPRLGEAVKEEEGKTADEYRKDWQQFSDMYQYCQEHLGATIKRKNASEEKKAEAMEMLQSFTKFRDSYERELSNRCVINTGEELQEK